MGNKNRFHFTIRFHLMRSLNAVTFIAPPHILLRIPTEYYQQRSEPKMHSRLANTLQIILVRMDWLFLRSILSGQTNIYEISTETNGIRQANFYPRVRRPCLTGHPKRIPGAGQNRTETCTQCKRVRLSSIPIQFGAWNKLPANNVINFPKCLSIGANEWIDQRTENKRTTVGGGAFDVLFRDPLNVKCELQRNISKCYVKLFLTGWVVSSVNLRIC